MTEGTEGKMADESNSMIALLMRQAEGQGAGTLRGLIEEASEIGAGRALEALGLKDGRARRDMGELRELLQAWRDAKKSALQAAVTWAVRIGLALLVLGMSVKLGLLGMLK
jgi:hypothetical protein